MGRRSTSQACFFVAGLYIVSIPGSPGDWSFSERLLSCNLIVPVIESHQVSRPSRETFLLAIFLNIPNLDIHSSSVCDNELKTSYREGMSGLTNKVVAHWSTLVGLGMCGNSSDFYQGRKHFLQRSWHPAAVVWSRQTNGHSTCGKWGTHDVS